MDPDGNVRMEIDVGCHLHPHPDGLNLRGREKKSN